jgi:hypothetical protein
LSIAVVGSIEPSVNARKTKSFTLLDFYHGTFGLLKGRRKTQLEEKILEVNFKSEEGKHKSMSPVGLQGSR